MSLPDTIVALIEAQQRAEERIAQLERDAEALRTRVVELETAKGVSSGA